MSMQARFYGVVVALLLSSGVASAQQPGLGLRQPEGQMLLDVVVTPKSGVPAPGLQQQDFTVLDNKTPQAITSFKALGGKDAPVEVIVVVDTVNTSYQTIAYERKQIDQFLTANGGHLAYPTTLAILTDTGTQIERDFTQDGNLIAQSLDRYDVSLRTIRRSAGFYGAAERFQLSISSLHLLADHEANRPGRKIILWVSPGWPLLSGPIIDLSSKQQQQLFSSIVDMSNQLRLDRITLYAVDPLGAGDSVFRTSYYQEFTKGVSKPSQVEAGDLGLQVLATQTGGLVLNSSNDIAALLERGMADAQAYYEISFDPPPSERPNEYHHVQVQLAKPGYTVRTRDGYYSHP